MLARAERTLRLARTDSGISRSERRFVGGGHEVHASEVSRYNRAVRRYSRALCALAMADYEAEVEEAREEARREALLAREDEIEAETGPMRLWHVSRTCRGGYDTYSDFVVVAATAEQARRVHPSKYARWDKATRRFVYRDGTPAEYGGWLDAIDTLEVTYVGDAADGMEPGKVICSSFHAG